MASIKVKRSMKLLLKVMVVLYKGLRHPKGKMSASAPNAKHDLTRVPIYGKALPIYDHNMSRLKIARRFCDKMEWVRT